MANREGIKCPICGKGPCRCPVINRGSFAQYIGKREEIREGGIRITKAYLDECSKRKVVPNPESLIDVLNIHYDVSGVVIKVDGELPICFGEFRTVKNQRESDYAVGFDDCKQAVRKAGYVAVEPLIED